MTEKTTDRIKVLMVDDEEQFRNTTSRILTKRGYETTLAGSGEEALNILRSRPHDVVILDIKMPGLSGNEVLPEIKDIDPKTQVIMLTGHGNMESAKESLKHKAFDYLLKPCDIDLLDRRIRDAYAVAHKGPREEKKAGDIMISIEDYTTIDEDATVAEGIRKLKESYENLVASSRLMESGHRSIMVFNRNKQMVGILLWLSELNILPCSGKACSHHRPRLWPIRRSRILCPWLLQAWMKWPILWKWPT